MFMFKGCWNSGVDVLGFYILIYIYIYGTVLLKRKEVCFFSFSFQSLLLPLFIVLNLF